MSKIENRIPSFEATVALSSAISGFAPRWSGRKYEGRQIRGPRSEIRNHRRGFTIAELVVASTITVLVAASTAGMLRSSSAVQERVSSQSELQSQARQAVEAVASAFRNAWLAGENDLMLEGEDNWAGDMPADRVRFFTVMRGAVRVGQPESDVKECEFFLMQDDQDIPPVLMRRLDPTRNDAPDGGGVLEGVAANVVGLNVAYFDGTEWLDEWPAEQKGWPMAVRVHVVVVDVKGGKTLTVSRTVALSTRTGQSGQSGSAGQGRQEEL